MKYKYDFPDWHESGVKTLLNRFQASFLNLLVEIGEFSNNTSVIAIVDEEVDQAVGDEAKF